MYRKKTQYFGIYSQLSDYFCLQSLLSESEALLSITINRLMPIFVLNSSSNSLMKLGAPEFDADIWQRVISSRSNDPVIKINCPKKIKQINCLVHLLCGLREAGETESLQS